MPTELFVFNLESVLSNYSNINYVIILPCLGISQKPHYHRFAFYMFYLLFNDTSIF